jgi:uncharacterized membrane protein YdjX (TVP38/TMEM64 family)
MSEISRYRLLQMLSLIVGFGVLAFIGIVFTPTEYLLLAQKTDPNWLLLIVGMVGLYVIRPFLLWPLSVFSVFIGYISGFPEGVPFVLLGTVLTCLPPFLLATRVGKDFAYFGQVAKRGAKIVETTGELRGMVAARLSPAPADAVSYSAGLAGVSAQSFAIGTLVGELPWAIFYVLIGQSLRSFSVGAVQQTDLRLILFTAVVSFLIIARPLYEFVRDNTKQSGDEQTGPLR